MHSTTSEAARTEARSKGHLLRILGVGFGIAVIVGNTIGSGILLTPGEVAARLGNSWFVFAVWSMGGIFAFLCTQSVSELGTMLPQAGGWYVYARQAFGSYGGFLAGCCDWMVQTAAIAYLAVAFGEFAAGLQPALLRHTKLVAVACLIVLMLLNWLGLRAGSRAQQITSLAKALALIAFVVACFVISPRAAPSSIVAPRSLPQIPPSALLFALIVALQPIVVSYDGWYGAIYFTEEDENPAKNLPRSSIAGVLACAAIFLLVNAALLHVLSIGKLAASQMPAADAAELIFGGHGRSMILFVSLVTAISAINASLMITPRILFAMARDGQMPGWVTWVNSGGTPAGALILCTAASIALVLSGSFETLVAMASILFVAVYLSGFLSLFVLRARQPDLPRPFRMWGYPWTNLGICLGAGAFLVASIIADLKHARFTVAVIALTSPLYLLMRKMRHSQEARHEDIQLTQDAEAE
ncbi:MAG: APC family permease [Acidobacteriota bacterium]|nr:APC family permease [Acidobacteriota bacterium]